MDLPYPANTERHYNSGAGGALSMHHQSTGDFSDRANNLPSAMPQISGSSRLYDQARYHLYVSPVVGGMNAMPVRFDSEWDFSAVGHDSNGWSSEVMDTFATFQSDPSSSISGIRPDLDTNSNHQSAKTPNTILPTVPSGTVHVTANGVTASTLINSKATSASSVLSDNALLKQGRKRLKRSNGIYAPTKTHSGDHKHTSQSDLPQAKSIKQKYAAANPKASHTSSKLRMRIHPSEHVISGLAIAFDASFDFLRQWFQTQMPDEDSGYQTMETKNSEFTARYEINQHRCTRRTSNSSTDMSNTDRDEPWRLSDWRDVEEATSTIENLGEGEPQEMEIDHSDSDDSRSNESSDGADSDSDGSEDEDNDPGTQGASGAGSESRGASGESQVSRDIRQLDRSSRHGKQNYRNSNSGRHHRHCALGRQSDIAARDNSEPTCDQQRIHTPLTLSASRMEASNSGVFHASNMQLMSAVKGVERLQLQTMRWLGRGASGTVDEVAHQGAFSSMARKVVLYRTAVQHERLETEVLIMKRMRHPHIVRLIEESCNSTSCTILMKPAADSSLSSLLQAGPPKGSLQDYSWRWFNCLVSGLNYMHSQDIIHGDIKPANILVKERHIFYADFGLSRFNISNIGIAKSENVATTYSADPGTITARYAAPEIQQGAREKPYDVWSLGCVFLNLLTWLLHESEGQSYIGQQVILYDALREIPYSRNLDNVTKWWSVLWRSAEQSSQESRAFQVLDLIQSILIPDPSQRPAAVALAQILTPEPCCLSRELKTTSRSIKRALQRSMFDGLRWLVEEPEPACSFTHHNFKEWPKVSQNEDVQPFWVCDSVGGTSDMVLSRLWVLPCYPLKKRYSWLNARFDSLSKNVSMYQNLYSSARTREVLARYTDTICAALESQDEAGTVQLQRLKSIRKPILLFSTPDTTYEECNFIVVRSETSALDPLEVKATRPVIFISTRRLSGLFIPGVMVIHVGNSGAVPGVLDQHASELQVAVSIPHRMLAVLPETFGIVYHRCNGQLFGNPGARRDTLGQYASELQVAIAHTTKGLSYPCRDFRDCLPPM
ncbi:Sperm motility kinase 2A [Xylographa bjoerkii]|nr:Sperm motility kinase 2A [Xylographa bjoerkii]